MVCVSEPTFPGCVIPVKPIALFKMRDEKGEDDKVVCVPLNDPGLEPRRDAGGHPGAASARDHPLLLHLQGARGQEGGRGGMAIARGGARGDRGRQSACRSKTTAKADRLPRCLARRRRRVRCRGATRHYQEVLPVQDRGLAAYIAELVGTLLLVFAICTVVVLYVATSANAQTGSDFAVVGLVHGVRPLRADHHPRRGRAAGTSTPPSRSRRRSCGGSTRSTRWSTSSPSSPAASSARCWSRRFLLDEGRASHYGAANDQPAARRQLRRRAWSRASGPSCWCWRSARWRFNPRARQEWAPLAIGADAGPRRDDLRPADRRARSTRRAGSARR